MYQAGTQYQLIYRDIVTSIYIGKRKKGESLPSLPELCRAYDAGRNTVRRALHLLKENGFIKWNRENPQLSALTWIILNINSNTWKK